MQQPRPPKKKPATRRPIPTRPARPIADAAPARPASAPAKPGPARPVSAAAKPLAAKPAAAKPAARSFAPKAGVVRVKAKEAPFTFDSSRGRGKRFFQMDTLENAVSGLLNGGDSWLGQALREGLLGGKPEVVTLELQWENEYAMVFRLSAATSRGQSTQLLLACAKNHQEHSERLRGEIDALTQLAPRCPEGILPMRTEGTLYMPQKYDRASGKGRQVLACVRAWPGRCVPAECSPNGQYMLAGPERRLLSRAESESYGAAIALLLLKSFDTLTRTGPSLNSLHDGDILCRHFRSGIAPAMMHCAKLTRYRSIQAYVKGLLLWEPSTGSGVYPLQLLSAESFVRALRVGLGEDLAPEALRRLSAPGGEVSLPDATLAALREAMAQPPAAPAAPRGRGERR